MLNSLDISKASESINDINIAKEGNKEAFFRLIEENKNQLYRIAKGIVYIESNDFNSNEKMDLWNALNSLQSQFRTVVVLFYYEDLTYKNISSILNISEGTIKSRLSRAKTKLEEVLNVAVGGEYYGK